MKKVKKSKASETSETETTDSAEATEVKVKGSKGDKSAKVEKTKTTPLQSLAVNINEVLGVEPALDVTAKDLESQIKEIMPEIQPEDKLSKESFAALKELGWNKKTKKSEKKSEKKSDKKSEKKSEKKSGPSNKEIVYKEWKKGKGKTDADVLLKTTKAQVQIGTVRSWLGSWKQGKNLPACANKE